MRPTLVSIAIAIPLSFIWLCLYWVIALPVPGEIFDVLHGYFSLSWNNIAQLSLTDHFLNSRKGFFCLGLMPAFDTAVLLGIKGRHHVPWRRGAQISFGALVVIGFLMGAVSSFEKPGPLEQILLQGFFGSIIVAKFFSYIVPLRVLVPVREVLETRGKDVLKKLKIERLREKEPEVRENEH